MRKTMKKLMRVWLAGRTQVGEIEVGLTRFKTWLRQPVAFADNGAGSVALCLILA